MSHSDDYFRSPPRRRIGLLALIRDLDGRVLVVDKRYQQDKAPQSCGLVGGSAEGDELPLTAWKREVAEETGLRLTPGRLLVNDYVPRNGTTAEGYNYVYDGGVLAPDTEIVLPPEELVGYALVPPAELESRMTAHGVRRTLAALEALVRGTVADLVYGFPAAEYEPLDEQHIVPMPQAGGSTTP